MAISDLQLGFHATRAAATDSDGAKEKRNETERKRKKNVEKDT